MSEYTYTITAILEANRIIIGRIWFFKVCKGTNENLKYFLAKKASRIFDPVVANITTAAYRNTSPSFFTIINKRAIEITLNTIDLIVIYWYSSKIAYTHSTPIVVNNIWILKNTIRLLYGTSVIDTPRTTKSNTYATHIEIRLISSIWFAKRDSAFLSSLIRAPSLIA